MMVSMASPLALPAPMSDTHSVSHPPCHAVADTTPGQPGSSEDEPGHGVGTACGCCLFCASALATVGETPQSIMVAVDPAHTALAVVAPAGEPDPFFRPPRR